MSVLHELLWPGGKIHRPADTPHPLFENDFYGCLATGRKMTTTTLTQLKERSLNSLAHKARFLEKRKIIQIQYSSFWACVSSVSFISENFLNAITLSPRAFILFSGLIFLFFFPEMAYANKLLTSGDRYLRTLHPERLTMHDAVHWFRFIYWFQWSSTDEIEQRIIT